MQQLSVVIITKDEQTNIGRCLASVTWADEIVIIDSGSTDATLTICEKQGCRIVAHHNWKGYGLQKQFAVTQATHDWILSVDADEEVSRELRKKIQAELVNPEYNGYHICRRSYYIEKLVRHCGWNHDFPLRLFNRTYGTFNSKEVHESVRLNGIKGRLYEPLFHYTYPTAQSHYLKMNRYAEMSAQIMYARGDRPFWGKGYLRAAAKFIKMYLLQAGFIDGKTGFMLSLRSAYGVSLKYHKLWQLSR